VSGWGWRISAARARSSVGTSGLHAFFVIVPFVTVGLLLLMLHIIGGTVTTARGVLFDLPAAGVGDEAVTQSVALIVPMRHETHVFFDDSRYVLGSEASMRSLGERLTERFAHSEGKSLLVLADRRVSCGDLMEFVARARQSGVEKVLVAEKNAQEAVE